MLIVVILDGWVVITWSIFLGVGDTGKVCVGWLLTIATPFVKIFCWNILATGFNPLSYSDNSTSSLSNSVVRLMSDKLIVSLPSFIKVDHVSATWENLSV